MCHRGTVRMAGSIQAQAGTRTTRALDTHTNTHTHTHTHTPTHEPKHCHMLGVVVESCPCMTSHTPWGPVCGAPCASSLPDRAIFGSGVLWGDRACSCVASCRSVGRGEQRGAFPALSARNLFPGRKAVTWL